MNTTPKNSKCIVCGNKRAILVPGDVLEKPDHKLIPCPNCRPVSEKEEKSKVEIPFSDGHKEVHYVHPCMDVTLCCHDETGDTDWGEGLRTTKTVDCDVCLKIVNFCRRINSQPTPSTPPKEDDGEEGVVSEALKESIRDIKKARQKARELIEDYNQKKNAATFAINGQSRFPSDVRPVIVQVDISYLDKVIEANSLLSFERGKQEAFRNI